MQVRVPILAALAALAAVPALAQPMSSAAAGADCFRRAPSGDAWTPGPCSAQAGPEYFPDGLAGGPPAYAPPPAYPAPGYAAADYSASVYAAPTYPGQAVDPPPYVEPRAQAVYDPNRAPYIAGNIGRSPAGAPLPLPAAPMDQAYLSAPPPEAAPLYAPAPAPSYGPPPLPDYGYGPNDCSFTGGALAGGGAWERRDCRATASADLAYPAPTYSPPPASAYAGSQTYGYSASSGSYSQQLAGGYRMSEGGYVYSTPSAPPAPGYAGDYASGGGYAYGGSSGYSQQQSGGYQSSGGSYAYAPQGALPGYGPGQCASSSGVIAGGRAQYEAQACERSSSQSYSYVSSSRSSYAGLGAPIVGDRPHWGVAGRDQDGFLIWPGKTGY